MPIKPLFQTASERAGGSDLALLLIRLLAGAALLYYHVAGMVRDAALHLWEGAEWGLADELAERGVPFPGIAATALTVLAATALAGATAGFFARANAAILALLAGAALFAALEHSPALQPQSLLLHFSLYTAVALGGAGRLSLDHLLSGRRSGGA